MVKNGKRDAKPNVIVSKTVKGTAVSILFYIAFSCITAMLILNGKISEEAAPDIAAALSFLSMFAGCMSVAGVGKGKRPIVGICTAAVVILIKLTVCALDLECKMFGETNLTVIGCIAFGGILASLLAMSKRKRV